MAFLTEDSFRQLLDALPLAAGDTLLVHSSLASLGPLRGVEPKETPDAVIEALERRLGAQGTLLMPTYAYDFPQTRRSDLRSAASTVGVLTERFRLSPGGLRSVHPMFSLAGRGGRAAELLRPEQPEWHPFGPDSTFARLHEADTMILMLGAEFRTCTPVVFSEHAHGVPYRYDKAFHGEVNGLDGRTHTGDFYHFCLPRSVEVRPDYSRAAADMLAEGVAVRVRAGIGSALYVRFRQMHEFLRRMLRTNPWYLVAREPEYLVRYADGVEVRVDLQRPGSAQASP